MRNGVGKATTINILCTDEPTTGLDPQTRVIIWQYLRQLRRGEGAHGIPRFRGPGKTQPRRGQRLESARESLRICALSG
jgi:hypothetical protein